MVAKLGLPKAKHEAGGLQGAWLSARCVEHSWMKQARLVFPVAWFFKVKEELNSWGKRGKERLASLSFQSPRELNTASLRPCREHPNKGGRSGKVCLTWDLQACDRKEFDYAPSFQPPMDGIPGPALQRRGSRKGGRFHTWGVYSPSFLTSTLTPHSCSSQWNWPQAKAMFPPFHSPHP